jgi:hypothetical protein
MFDQFFTRAHAHARHLNSPLLQERLDYLSHCAEHGYQIRTLRERAQTLLCIQKLLKLAVSSNAIAPATIEMIVNRAFRARMSGARRKQIVSVAIDWLDFMKRLRRPEVALSGLTTLEGSLCRLPDGRKGPLPADTSHAQWLR